MRMNLCQAYNKVMATADAFLGPGEPTRKFKRVGPIHFVGIMFIIIFCCTLIPIYILLRIVGWLIDKLPDFGILEKLNWVYYSFETWWNQNVVSVCPVELKKKDCEWHRYINPKSIRKKCTCPDVVSNPDIPIDRTEGYDACAFLGICIYAIEN